MCRDSSLKYDPPTLLGECGRTSPKDDDLQRLSARRDWHGLVEAMVYWLGVWADDMLRARGLRRTEDRRQEMISEGALALVQLFRNLPCERIESPRHLRNYCRKAVKRALMAYLDQREVVGVKHTTIKKRRARLRKENQGQMEGNRLSGEAQPAAEDLARLSVHKTWEWHNRIELLESHQPLYEDGSPFWQMIDSLAETAVDVASDSTREAAQVILNSNGHGSVAFAARRMGLNRRTLADRLNKLAKLIPPVVSEEIDAMATDYFGKAWENCHDASATLENGSKGNVRQAASRLPTRAMAAHDACEQGNHPSVLRLSNGSGNPSQIRSTPRPKFGCGG
jgi:hypothetical protein